jgi:hypothetical protein
MIIAPPAPWRARAAMRNPMFGRDRGQRRGRREDRDAGHERASTSESFADGGRGEQQHGEGQGVGVDGPLESRESGVEVNADDRQCRRHDQVVERGHEECEAGDEHGPGATVTIDALGVGDLVGSTSIGRVSVVVIGVLLALAPPPGNS